MEDKIKPLIRNAMEKKIFPGCVVGYICNAQSNILPFGKVTYDNTSSPVTPQTIYDVASITKAIPTSSLALFLIDQGKMNVDDKVTTYIPELQIPQREDLTIWHLLTQTVDFALRLSQEKTLSADMMWQKILTTSLRRKVGTSYSYTNAASILLGCSIERVSGKSLDVFANEFFFSPLGMTQTTFHPEHVSKEQIAPSEIDEWRGREIRAEVHDESSYVLRNKMIAGSAGLFSTVPDLMIFLQMLLAGGSLNGKNYFSEKMIKRLATNQIAYLGETTGLGWELSQSWYMGKYATEHTFGKTGFTGCHVVCDVQKRKALVLLSNSTYPKRPESRDAINNLRWELADIVFAD